MATLTDKAARDALMFYVEAGVDALLDETPHDRLSEPAPEPAPVQPAAQAAKAVAPTPAVVRPSVAPQPPSDAAMAARAAARNASTLDELRTILEGFDGCHLKTNASRLVFADGNPTARLMLVGEAPGEEEDAQGLPFVGRSGRLLNLMLGAIGLDRTDVYIANIVPWRPPGNRTPTPAETQICLPFLQRQIELVAPDVLVTLGNPSTQTLLRISDGITRTRGRWSTLEFGGREVRVMPTFHPAFLLRSPLQKRLAWRDLLAVKAALGRAP